MNCEKHNKPIIDNDDHVHLTCGSLQCAAKHFPDSPPIAEYSNHGEIPWVRVRIVKVKK